MYDLLFKGGEVRVMMRSTERPVAFHRIAAAGLLLLWVSLSGVQAVQQSTWRPFDNHAVLVTLGMSKGEVLLKAGEPDLADVMAYGSDDFQPVTVWTYIRTGHNAAIATLTFSGNILTRIEIKIVHP